MKLGNPCLGRLRWVGEVAYSKFRGKTAEHVAWKKFSREVFSQSAAIIASRSMLPDILPVLAVSNSIPSMIVLQETRRLVMIGPQTHMRL